MNTLTPGILLARRYRLIDRIGAGGMSVIWRSRDEVLDRVVAVKVLAASLAADARFRGMVRDEARSAAQLVHPHVATVHDYGETVAPDGTVTAFVVMELLAGEELEARLTEGPLPWPAAVEVCAQVAEALAAAHRLGIVHRDVTPANIMMTATGAKVLDFGIATRIGAPDEDADGETFGTPAYVAPERLDGTPAQPATDTYALGVLLYETLTGHVPIPADTWDDLTRALQSGRTPSPPDVPGLPAEVAALCMGCLARDPRSRPTAHAAARVLRAAAAARGPVPATTALAATPTTAGASGPIPPITAAAPTAASVPMPGTPTPAGTTAAAASVPMPTTAPAATAAGAGASGTMPPTTAAAGTTAAGTAATAANLPFAAGPAAPAPTGTAVITGPTGTPGGASRTAATGHRAAGAATTPPPGGVGRWRGSGAAGPVVVAAAPIGDPPDPEPSPDAEPRTRRRRPLLVCAAAGAVLAAAAFVASRDHGRDQPVAQPAPTPAATSAAPPSPPNPSQPARTVAPAPPPRTQTTTIGEAMSRLEFVIDEGQKSGEIRKDTAIDLRNLIRELSRNGREDQVTHLREKVAARRSEGAISPVYADQLDSALSGLGRHR